MLKMSLLNKLMDKRKGEKSTQAHQIDLSSGNHCFLGVFWKSLTAGSCCITVILFLGSHYLLFLEARYWTNWDFDPGDTAVLMFL